MFPLLWIAMGDDFIWPYQAAEIEAVYRAIEKTGRDIVLSLSPGDHSDTANADHLARHCEMWRISSGVWDRWEQALRPFDECSRWAGFAGPGYWPDPDMLPLGRIGIRQHPLNGPDRLIRLTSDEQRTLMILWCIARALLMFGGDMPSLDEFILSLLIDPEVLDVNRNSASSREMLRRDGHIA
ncbi:MAG: hypothetical protein IT210_18020 [Armatimonadetes bacterium]|nr:hypothetical protein [Armatimonadota bacterium]